MMNLLNVLSGPVIGAAIGYITNDIAIRMLFRPHKAVYVFGRRLPFTPGIVPRKSSTSFGELFSPPRIMRSFSRPVM